ncbi:hypothetical protein RJ641_006382 [Dillenia turbinata]|uniref:Uncharacterized protein n=1 Tax=Dillenia turbinata TaxID=194707 RepID=A0AAN8VDC8_9MAGN
MTRMVPIEAHNRQQLQGAMESVSAGPIAETREVFISQLMVRECFYPGQQCCWGWRCSGSKD